MFKWKKPKKVKLIDKARIMLIIMRFNQLDDTYLTYVKKEITKLFDDRGIK